jgi:calcium-dependent protein kinase
VSLQKKPSFSALKGSKMLSEFPEFRSSSKTGFVVDGQGMIEDVWCMSKKAIGEGSYGQVFRALNRKTNEIRAIKKVAKEQLKLEELQRMGDEVNIMKVMDHPGILKLFATFEDTDSFFFVLEFCSGGELFDRLEAETAFTEDKAAVLMEQIFRIVYYLHEKKVAHRDLKPENFLFMSQGPIDSTPMKLIDFGMAAAVPEQHFLTTKCGTPYYVAPEVLKGSYRETCDEWSCGILMYVMLCGYPPFNATTDKAILKKVQQGKFSFPPEDWQDTSASSQKLITRLLCLEPAGRCTARDALGDEWVKTFCSSKAGAVKAKQMTGLMRNLKSFQCSNKLKKATLHVMAKLANDDKVKSLRQVFVALDTSGDGKISVSELRAGLEQTGLLDDDGLANALKDVDADGNGEIDYSEWIAATLESKQYLEQEVCRSAFNVFDRDGNGKISREELELVLTDTSIRGIVGDDALQVIDDIMQEADGDGGDGDGEIDFEEFMRMIQSGVPPPRSSNNSRRNSEGE